MQKYLLLLAATVAVTGCRSTVNVAGPASERSRPTVIQDKRVVTDKGLRKKAGIVNIRESIIDGDLLKAQVQLYNATGKPQHVNYRFQWFNANGMKVETLMSSWNAKTIYGKETVWISGIAPRPDVTSFKFKLIESKR